MHSLSAEKHLVRPQRPGVYRVRGMINFASNPTGFRRVIVRKEGTAVTKQAFAAVNGESTSCPFDCDVDFTAADVAANVYINIDVYQTSGLSLNINADRWMKVEKIRAF